MPPLNQISKEEIEKFRSEFVEGGSECTWVNYPVVEEIEQSILASHLRLIDGMIALAESKKVKVHYDIAKPHAIRQQGYNQALNGQILALQSEKENIKNESNKMNDLTTVSIWLIKKLCVDTNATTATLNQTITHNGEELGTYKITIEKV